jgi:hypothetical protein
VELHVPVPTSTQTVVLSEVVPEEAPVTTN